LSFPFVFEDRIKKVEQRRAVHWKRGGSTQWKPQVQSTGFLIDRISVVAEHSPGKTEKALGKAANRVNRILAGRYCQRVGRRFMFSDATKKR